MANAHRGIHRGNATPMLANNAQISPEQITANHAFFDPCVRVGGSMTVGPVRAPVKEPPGACHVGDILEVFWAES